MDIEKFAEPIESRDALRLDLNAINLSVEMYYMLYTNEELLSV